MAKKFNSQDFFEQGTFDAEIRKMEDMLRIIKEMEAAMRGSVKDSKKYFDSFKNDGGLDGLRKSKKAIDEVNQSTDASLKLRQEEMKLQQQLNALKTEQAKKNERLRQAIIEENKAIREEIKNEKALIDIQNKEIKTIQQLQDRNNALIRTRKNLDLTTKQGIADYRKFTEEIKKNNATLSKHDAAIGSYVRNVGNYGSAIKGFGTQLLGILGAGSFLAIAQNAIQATAEFDQSMADLKAITGATDEQMKFFRDTAIEQTLSMEGSTASAKDYTEALKLIASAKPELLENEQALKQITDQALILADASGLELPDAATRLTDAMNQFGAGADQAGKFVDVLAAAAKYGSAEIPQITEALLEFGPVAKSYNVSIQESAAAIEGLAEKGIKGTEAGTKLRNVLLALGAAKGLPKEAQESFERVGIDVNILSDNSLTLEERLNELSKAQNDEVAMLKIFGKENISAAKTVLAQKDRIAELTEKVDENGVAQEQAGIRTNTLAGEWKKLGNAWQSEMIKMAGSGGDLKKLVEFIRKNLGTIISAMTNLAKMFVVFKTFQTGMKLFSVGTDIATTSFKNLNSAMQANVIGMIATAVYALADSLGFFESEADRIAAKLERQRSEIDEHNQKFDERAEKEKQTLSENISALDKDYKLRRDLALKNGEDVAKIDKDYHNQWMSLMGTRRDELTLEAAQAKARFKDLNDVLEGNERLVGLKEQLIRAERLLEENRSSYNIKEVARIKKSIEKDEVERKKAYDDFVKLTAERKGLIDEIISKGDEQVLASKDQNNEQTENTKIATEQQIAEWKRKSDEIKRIELELRNWLADLQSSNIQDDQSQEIAQEELRFQRELQKLQEKNKILGKTTAEAMLIEQELKIAHREKLKEIDKKYSDLAFKEGLEDLEFKYQLMEDEAIRTIENEEELDAKLKQLKIDQLGEEIKMLESNLASEEDIIEKRIELDKLLREQQNKTLDDAKKKSEALADAIKAGLDGTKDALEKQKQQTSDLIEASKVLSDELTKIFTDASKKREDAIDKEIEHSQERQDQLREIAERGVLEANQSLAAEERKQAELERKKLEEQKKQKRIELANTAFKAYVGHVDNKDQSPLTSTIRDITALTAFISSLPAFYEGTENTGKGGNLDDKGGFTAILHPNERVMTAKQNKELAGLSNSEVVKIVKESQYIHSNSDNAINNMKMADKFAMDMAWNSNEQIVSKVDELIKTVENKPVQLVYVDQVTDKLVSEIRKGSNVTRTHYSKPNING
jgi:TP901 family phage tail tape measure protein